MEHALARGAEDYEPQGQFFDAIARDPVLSKVKLIAEPWDVGPAGYRLGGISVLMPKFDIQGVFENLAKYKVKNFIDTTVYRFGDVIGIWTIRLMMSAG